MLLLLASSLSWGAVQTGLAQTPMYYFEVTVIISDNSDPVTRDASQLIVNELPKVGIIPSFYLLTEVEFNERVSGSLSHEDYANGGFDIAIIQHSPQTTFDHLYDLFHSSNIKPASYGTNYFPVDNKTLDGILEYVMNTTDFEERKEWIRQALELIVWDIHPMIVFYHEVKGPNAWTFLSLSYNILKGAGGKLTNKLARLAISHMVPHPDIHDLFGASSEQNFAPFPRESSYWPEDLKSIQYNFTKSIEYIDQLGLVGSEYTAPGYNLSLRYPNQYPNPTPGFEFLGFFLALASISVIFAFHKRKNRLR